MKLMIPVDDTKNAVCVSFGRAPFFALYDTETEKLTYIENEAAEAESGAGLKAAPIVCDNGADVLLTIRLGQNSADVFKAAGIEIYKTDGMDVLTNCKAYVDGKLEKLTAFHAGYHGRR